MQRSPQNQEWLLFFYSVPSKPVKNRMQVWRLLTKSGALQLKGAVYVLPFTEDHLELCQWLTSTITAMGGEADFVRTAKLETMQNREVIELFSRQREKDYLGIGKKVEEVERWLSGGMPGLSRADRKILEQLNRCRKEFEELGRIDFFISPARARLEEKMDTLTQAVRDRLKTGATTEGAKIRSRQPAHYQEKIWVTRKNPYVDRMASAWLVRKFIDAEARFGFTDTAEAAPAEGTIYFDIPGGEFTHVGDLTTFEVLIEAFGLSQKALRRMAEIIHQIDLQDDKYQPAEAGGVRGILEGIRLTAQDDHAALLKGMDVVEWLYATKTRA